MPTCILRFQRSRTDNRVIGGDDPRRHIVERLTKVPLPSVAAGAVPWSKTDVPGTVVRTARAILALPSWDVRENPAERRLPWRLRRRGPDRIRPIAAVLTRILAAAPRSVMDPRDEIDHP